MRRELILLGTGTSVGVPVIGCRCPICTSTNPRNQRTRTGVFVPAPEGNFLIDTSPELRLQLLREKIELVHAAIFTHSHADHIFGLDDLRIFGYRLDPAGTYQRIVPDGEGRLLSETTGLWFSISPEGDRVMIRDIATNQLLRTSLEEERDRKAAEEALEVFRARTAAAETELSRMRAEIERLRSALSGDPVG